uniref:Uncharacterized protein n=1 Tax=Onchocerca volvulus TaxID=6282 RepID=A0A8R1TS66_ONCVO
MEESDLILVDIIKQAEALERSILRNGRPENSRYSNRAKILLRFCTSVWTRPNSTLHDLPQSDSTQRTPTGLDTIGPNSTERHSTNSTRNNLTQLDITQSNSTRRISAQLA